MKNRILSFVLMLALVVAAAINPMLSYATEATTGTPTEMAIEDYRKDKDADGNYTKVPTAPTGYVFGGWYTTAACDEPIAANKTTGNAFAKWVPNNVLSVKYQTTADTTIYDTTTNLRLVTTVDSVNYSKVGFVLNNGERDSKPAMANTVYEKIRGIVNGVPTDFEPETTFGAPADFFMIYEVAVPNDVFATSFTVIPRWITLDGTLVEGVANDFKIDDIADEVLDEKVTFEEATDMKPFSGNAVANNKLTLSRVAYGTDTIEPMDDGFGNYVLQGTTTNTAPWPRITIDFGKTYAAGTKVNFYVYVKCNEDVASAAGTYMVQMAGNKATKTDSDKMSYNVWNEWTFTLSQATDTVTIQGNFDAGQGVSKLTSGDVYMYYDNFCIGDAETFYEGDGLTFEGLVNTEAVLSSDGAPGTNSYWLGCWSANKLSVSKTYFDSAHGYTMMGTFTEGTSSQKYPEVRLDFGEDVPQYSELTFDIYVDPTDVNQTGTFKLGSNGFYTDEAGTTTRATGVTLSKDGSTTFAIRTWHTVTLSFTSEFDHMRIYLELGGALKQSGAEVNIYYDNFCIQKMESFKTGITFDGLFDTEAVTGSDGLTADGKYPSDWSANKLSLAKASFDGSHTMMGTFTEGTTSQKYPAIRLDFSEELPVDTKLTFDVYLEPTEAETGIFQMGANGYLSGDTVTTTKYMDPPLKNENQVSQMTTGEWHTVSLTFTAPHTHMRVITELKGDLKQSGATCNIYFDNFLIETPNGTAVTKGQTIYLGALTKENALKTELYSANQTLLGTVAEEDLILVDSMSDTYGIYSYTVNADDVKYVYTPLNARSAYYATIVKEDNTASKEDIMKEFATAMGIATPSESAVDVLTGKTALFLGDSVVQGVLDKNCIYSEKGYAGRIGYYYNLGAVQNNAQSGACLGYNEALIEERANERYYIYNQLAEEIEKGSEYDYIIMHGLYNDKPRNAIGTPMGPDNFDVDQVDITTMAGALEMLFYTAQTEFATAKLGFIVMFDAKEGKDISDYAAMAMQICEEWGVPYLDLLTGSNKGVLADGTVIDLPDNLHPSSAGYDSYYAKIGDWMATIE